jgi:alpha-beta hydrolase superfamily lysophospholipase
MELPLDSPQQTLKAHVSLLLLIVVLYGCSPTRPIPVEPEIAGTQYVPDASFAGLADVYAASDGAALGYVRYDKPGAKTALVYLHGIESHSGWFAKSASLLREQGYAVYCLDRRGSGINRENRGFVSGHVDSYKTLLADVSAFIQPLRNRYDSVFLVGLSWGGKLALSYGLTHPADIGGLVLITPGIRTLVDVSLFTKFKILFFSRTQPMEPIATPIKPEMFTTTPRTLEFIQRDPLRLKYATAGFFFESRRLDGYIDGLISNLRLPVQLFLAGEDRIIDNEGVRLVLEQGSQDKLEIVTYEDQTHSIQLDATERMVQDIVRWLRRYQ